MDVCGVGAEPKYWEGAGTAGPNQLCFRVLKKPQILEGFLFRY